MDFFLTDEVRGCNSNVDEREEGRADVFDVDMEDRIGIRSEVGDCGGSEEGRADGSEVGNDVGSEEGRSDGSEVGDDVGGEEGR